MMLVYDGDCAFCTRCARWFERRAPEGVQVVPWAAVDDLGVLGLTPEDVQSAAWWVDDAGGLHRGHQAVAEALGAIGGVWRPVGRLVGARLVSPLAAATYAVIVRNRDRMPGGSGTCRIDPGP